LTISFSARFPLRPQRGGFTRPFGCGWFIREYLAGRSPYGAAGVNPAAGAPQSEIFAQYKLALIREWAMDRAMRQAESGTPVPEVCRKMGIAEQTFYRWKKKYAGMGVAEVRKLRILEEENRKLKQLVADLSLDKQMLQDVLRKKD